MRNDVTIGRKKFGVVFFIFLRNDTFTFSHLSAVFPPFFHIYFPLHQYCNPSVGVFPSSDFPFFLWKHPWWGFQRIYSL